MTNQPENQKSPSQSRINVGVSKEAHELLKRYCDENKMSHREAVDHLILTNFGAGDGDAMDQVKRLKEVLKKAKDLKRGLDAVLLREDDPHSS